MRGERGERSNMGFVKCLITFIILSVFVNNSAAALSVSAVLGQTVELPCSCLENKTATAMQFTRPEFPDQDQYVLLYRDGRSDKTRQIPAYFGRVDWTSNWTLLIHNVTHRDQGTYNCSGFYSVPGLEDPQEVWGLVTLTVEDGNKRNPDRKSQPAEENILSRLRKIWKIIILILIIFGIVVCIIICLRKYIKKWCKKKTPLDDEDEESRKVFI